jgi:hypothetical protein
MQPRHGGDATDETRLFQSQACSGQQSGGGTAWMHTVARFSDGDVGGPTAWPDGTIIRSCSKLRAVVQTRE